jgi:hypothetical protein
MIIGVEWMTIQEPRGRVLAGEPDDVVRSALTRLLERTIEQPHQRPETAACTGATTDVSSADSIGLRLLPRCYPGGWVLASLRVSSRPFSVPPLVSQKHSE